MIADIHITEKSFGDKTLMRDVKFSVDDGEKVGVVGRNGVGKSTLFGVLAGADTDYTGEVIFRRGITVASTAQEHHGLGDQTVLSYILAGLPEYAALKKIIDEYPETMGDNMRKIEGYTQALERFDQKGFYQIEEKIERELDNFQLNGCGERPLGSLSGGQKRLVEIVKIMHAGAHLALIDEPTNHMDYVAKQQFIDWMSSQPRQAMLIITHDRDVLGRVDRIVELKDGQAVSYRGNYDAYLKQNAQATAAGMNNFEHIEKRMTNLKQKVLDYQRLKEKSRNPGTIQKFKRLENEARAELAELSEMDKPTFWIDKESAGQLDYKSAERYGKFKARNIRLSMKDAASRSQHVLVRVEDAAVGVGERILFEGVNIDLREGEAVELRGRNGAGKTTLIRMLLASGGVVARASHKTIRDPLKPAQIFSEIPLAPNALTATPLALECALEETAGKRTAAAAPPSSARAHSSLKSPPEIFRERSAETSATRERFTVSGVGGVAPAAPVLYSGNLFLDPQVRVGVYEQEIDERYLADPLEAAIEKLYLSRDLPISETKIRQLLADYLFTEADRMTPLARLSGGQKARFQIIAMLANDPQLLILDEPTNHLDLPSIEELETALAKYSGAILYVSHDNYFRQEIGGEVVQIGAA
ncbi:ATP-binding cassette domain-containing protein [Candidatus Nanosynbacter lyticus]|uniref:ATP-binding cassette domain-containing protein n=1 Tax=Candidatus Nanosynbacter lyticus TaxID=2093824 RepID=UPI002557C020|nr:ATP-binding cassette domain-containing protein [Candidatus Nanosynbacter lyticus]